MQDTGLSTQRTQHARNVLQGNTLHMETTPAIHVLLVSIHRWVQVLVLSAQQVHSLHRQGQHLVTVVRLDMHQQRGLYLAINVSLEHTLRRRLFPFLQTSLRLHRADCSCTIASTLYLDPV